jgi:hypothetical protein
MILTIEQFAAIAKAADPTITDVSVINERFIAIDGVGTSFQRVRDILLTKYSRAGNLVLTADSDGGLWLTFNEAPVKVWLLHGDDIDVVFNTKPSPTKLMKCHPFTGSQIGDLYNSGAAIGAATFTLREVPLL